MKSHLNLALALAVLAAPAMAQEDFWGEEDAQKACAPFEHYQPGPAAQPTEQDRKTFAGDKDCLPFFYDPAGANDYDKGRRCCLARGDCNRELAMAFANGWGTKRDLDAATYFLCRAGGEMAPAEHWGMLQFLHGLRTGKETGSLDFCDQVTSGVGASWCTGLAFERKEVEWDRRIQTVEQPLGKEARQALAALRKAAAAFMQEDSALTAEPNRGGTIYSSMVLEGRIRRGDAFAADLERYTRNRAPAASPAALESADGALNTAYKKLVALSGPCPKDDPYCGNYDRDVVRDAQRSWLPYRDAWIAFYRLRWKEAAPPEALDREIAAALTEQRTKELGQVGAEE